MNLVPSLPFQKIFSLEDFSSRGLTETEAGHPQRGRSIPPGGKVKGVSTGQGSDRLPGTDRIKSALGEAANEE